MMGEVWAWQYLDFREFSKGSSRVRPSIGIYHLQNFDINLRIHDIPNSPTGQQNFIREIFFPSLLFVSE